MTPIKTDPNHARRLRNAKVRASRAGIDISAEIKAYRYAQRQGTNLEILHFVLQNVERAAGGVPSERRV